LFICNFLGKESLLSSKRKKFATVIQDFPTHGDQVKALALSEKDAEENVVEAIQDGDWDTAADLESSVNQGLC
jgi:hypothetical protein